MPRVIRTSRARRPAAGRGPSRLLTGVGHQAGLVLAPGSRGGRAAAAGAGPSASLWPGKLGITRSMPVSAKTRRTMALAGMTSRNSPPSGQGPLVRPHQDAEPGRIAELGGGHVHHERGVAAGRGFEENRPQPPGVAGIDIRGRRHHGVRKDAEPGFLRLSGLHQGRDGHRVCFGGSPDAGLRRRAVLHWRRARA